MYRLLAYKNCKCFILICCVLSVSGDVASIKLNVQTVAITILDQETDRVPRERKLCIPKVNRLPVAFIDPFVRMCVHSNMWMMLFFCRNMGGSLNHCYYFWHFQFDWIWFPVAIIVRHSHSCCLEKRNPKEIDRNASNLWNTTNRIGFPCVLLCFYFSL